jgi:hypothetical protein
MSERLKVAVLGGGSFGTAIANIIACNNHQTYLWMRSEEQAAQCKAPKCPLFTWLSTAPAIGDYCRSYAGNYRSAFGFRLHSQSLLSRCGQTDQAIAGQ